MSEEQVRALIALIDKAIYRVRNGMGLMRVPADPTDPDLVLADCKAALLPQAQPAVQESRNKFAVLVNHALLACSLALPADRSETCDEMERRLLEAYDAVGEAQPALQSEAAASIALDGDTRQACNNPDCDNDWPCSIHPEAQPASESGRRTLAEKAQDADDSDWIWDGRMLQRRAGAQPPAEGLPSHEKIRGGFDVLLQIRHWVRMSRTPPIPNVDRPNGQELIGFIEGLYHEYELALARVPQSAPTDVCKVRHAHAHLPDDPDMCCGCHWSCSVGWNQHCDGTGLAECERQWRAHVAQTCEICGTEIVKNCPKCGAPQCCPKCCVETESPSMESK